MRRLRTESTRPRNRAVPRTASPNRRVPLRASKADARGRSAIVALGNASVTPVAGVTPSGCGDACSGRRTRRTRTASRRTRRGRCDGPPDPGCDYWEPDEQPGACHSGEYFPWRCARRTNLERASRPGSSHHTCVLAGCRCWSRVKRSRLSVPVAGSQLSDSGRAPTGHWRRVRCSFPGEAIARRRRGLRVLGRQGDRQLGDPLDERSCARCARRVAPPQWGFRRWASTRPVSRPDRQAATEPPGSYPDGTHTRWRRRAYVGFSYSIPPPTLGARTIRASLWTAFPSGRGRSGQGLGAAPFAWWRGRLMEE